MPIGKHWIRIAIGQLLVLGHDQVVPLSTHFQFCQLESAQH